MNNVCVSTVFILMICLSTSVHADFDTSICNITHSAPPPIPALAPSYSTTVEWKLLHENTTVLGKELVDGINKVSSLKISKEGKQSQIIFDYKNGQYSIVDENGCNTMLLDKQLAPLNNILWYTTTKQLYTAMKQTGLEPLGSSTIRNTNVNSWKTCMYLYQFNITVEITMSFAVDGWPMPGVPPNAMVPVRIEMRGVNVETHFHVIGDYIDFKPAPPPDPQQLQPPPGTFCSGKFHGQSMVPVPTKFNAVIEKIDTTNKRVTFQTIWFDNKKKLVRYDTKSADGTDSDPKTIILDFIRGIRYEIDPYIGTCNLIDISRGDNYVDMSIQPPRIQMQNSSSFFHTDTKNIQYVGKRFTRGIVCDVWVGVYFDYQTNRNQTIEWYFMEDNWVEAAGLSLTPGSLVRYDIWAGGSSVAMVHNVHKMDPTGPVLMDFDVGACFKDMNKIHFIVKFIVSDVKLISEISLSYLLDDLQGSLSQSAAIESTRLSNIAIENYGGPDIYLIATLLDKVAMQNFYIYPPPPLSHTLTGAFDFLTGTIYNPWVHNVTTRVGKKVLLTATGIIKISYPGELTTTTVASTTKGTYKVPTLPHANSKTTGPVAPPTPPAETTTKLPTPSPPGPTTTRKPVVATTKTKTTTPFLPVTSKRTTPRKYINTKTQAPKTSPCVCPKVTCPAIPQTPKPNPPVICTTPSTTTTTTAAATTPIPTTTKQTGKVSTLASTQRQPPSSNGVSSGAAAGIAIAMIIVGVILGVIAMKIYQVKFANGVQHTSIMNPVYERDMQY